MRHSERSARPTEEEAVMLPSASALETLSQNNVYVFKYVSVYEYGYVLEYLYVFFFAGGR